MNTNIQEQKQISNERAIANLMVAYAFANDDADIKKLGEMYKDAVFKLGDISVSGREEIEALAGNMIKVKEDGRSQTTHEITNIMIEVDKSGVTAAGNSYWTLYKTISGTSREALLSGRYQDSFLYHDGQWAFKERKASILWKLDDSMFG